MNKSFRFTGLLETVTALTFLAAAPLCGFAAVSAGALRMEVVCAYNLVVDSNAGTPSSYAPKSA